MIQYQLPTQLDEEIDHLATLIEKHQAGEMSEAELKANRVPFGIYEQRERDTYMVRIRCAGGVITPVQLHQVAKIAGTYASCIHLTSRQELQLHYVTVTHLIAVLKSLKKAGLASRGGGGNTVRNIIAQEDAGIAKDEVFDVTPYAIALTNRLIAENDSWTLPRKYKIAFSGSSDDRGHAVISDLGFIASLKNGKRGFQVFVAGGLGAKSALGNCLFNFVPDTEVYALAKAIKNLFRKYGNRKNKHAARLRFLWQQLGEDEFRKRFTEIYEEIRSQGVPPLEIQEIENNSHLPDLEEVPHFNSDEFDIWQNRFVHSQKQENLYSILVPVELGFISIETLENFASFLIPYGENVLRLTKNQNFLIRNIEESALPHLFNFLKTHFKPFNRPVVLDNILSCAGASTCQLGICLSGNATKALVKKLEMSSIDLDQIKNLKIHVSGCPNSCGQHPAADIGFFGRANRQGDRLYPAYQVVAGARIQANHPMLAEKVGEVSAYDLPDFATKLIRDYLDHQKNGFQQYYNEIGKSNIPAICKSYASVPSFQEDKNYYYDWEAEQLFSLANRGTGECSAGLFDLIEVDLNHINDLLKHLSDKNSKTEKSNILEKLVYHASRMLLITRGVEPHSETEAYTAFIRHFIDTGLVDTGFQDLIESRIHQRQLDLTTKEKQIIQFVEDVKTLYSNMDHTFQFFGTLKPVSKSDTMESAKKQNNTIKKTKDLLGVACPMNFVKTKMELASMKAGEILEILLDDGEPIDNVPGSVKSEGHQVLEQEKIKDHWRVVIKKGES